MEDQQTRGRIALVARKMPLAEQPSDFTYWQTQSYQDRLAALEAIRREYHEGRYASEPGFQRVFQIIKR